MKVSKKNGTAAEESIKINSEPIKSRQRSSKESCTCETCSKSFSCTAYLRAHERIHKNDRPFSCNVCNRRFKRVGNLNSHKYTHSKKKPHQCIICGRAFAQLSSQIVHMRIHTGLWWKIVSLKLYLMNAFHGSSIRR